jgi:hypothetical protein
MASFTDQISQFNPYIQELPVEAMVQVGMAKQAQYNQGVQKVQNYIDRISGLEIIKPQHKQYLQSVMGELGNKLKTVAAGDFSNQQLVNSVAGMTGQIAKDPIVQNAVSSTNYIKKGYGEIETARKAGKSNKDNEDYYEARVNNWMTNPDLKTPFQGRYTEFTDVDKKLRGLAEELKKNPSSTSIDQPFVRNDKGETLYFKTVIDPTTKKKVTVSSIDPSQGGEKQLDLDMLRIKVKGTPAQQLYDTFTDNLTSNDIEQLKINSWAKFKGADTKTFQDSILDTYKLKKDMLNEQITTLAVELQNPKLTSAQKSQGNAILKTLTDMHNNGVLDTQMNKDLSSLDKDIKEMGLDEYKYKIYKDNHLTRLAQDLSFKTYEEERVTNPAAQQQQSRLEFQLKQLEFQDASKYRYLNWKNADARLKWEMQVKAQELAPTSLLDVTEGTIGTGKNIPTVGGERKDLVSILSQKSELDSKWAKYIFPDLKEANQYTSALGGLLNDYRKNPQMNLTANQKAYIKEAELLDNAAQSKINVINYAENKGLDKAVNNTIAKLGTKTITTDDGKTFTSKEIATAVSKLADFKTQASGGYYTSAAAAKGDPRGINVNPNTSAAFDVVGAANFFANYEGGKYKSLIMPIIKQQQNRSTTATETANLKSINSALGIFNDELSNRPKYESEALMGVSPSTVSQKATLSPDLVKGDELALDRFLTKAIGRYNALEQKPNWNADNVAKAWNTRKSGAEEGAKIGWEFEKFRDGTAQIIMSKGTSKEIIPVESSDLRNYFTQATQTSPFNQVRDLIYTSPTKTTNLAGATDDNPSNAINARYSGYDLPQLEKAKDAPLFRYDIVGSPNNTGRAETDQFLFVGYVKDPKTDVWKRKELSDGYEGEGKMLQIMTLWNKDNITEAQKTWK